MLSVLPLLGSRKVLRRLHIPNKNPGREQRNPKFPTETMFLLHSPHIYNRSMNIISKLY